MTRLNKHIARTLGISRREADDLIDSGKVMVDGKTAHLGQQSEKHTSIVIDGKELDQDTPAQYIALNKPVGYVCSRKQQGDSPTIYSLLPPEIQQLKTVGRLDRDSSGIILLTNDGDFAHSMTHPSFSKVKIYDVELNKPLEPLHQQMISDHGVQLEDGLSKFMIEKIEAHSKKSSEKIDSEEASNKISYKITMKEGRNRQIRRTFDALGYTVTKLHRIQFGNFSLVNLTIDSGNWKKINI